MRTSLTQEEWDYLRIKHGLTVEVIHDLRDIGYSISEQEIENMLLPMDRSLKINKIQKRFGKSK